MINPKKTDLNKLLNPEKAIWPYRERRNKTALSPFSLELSKYNYVSYQDIRNPVIFILNDNFSSIIWIYTLLASITRVVVNDN